MANYVIRIARSATIVALFAVAAMLGILSGVLFAFAGDLPRNLGARQLQPEHDHARLRRNGRRDRRVRRAAPAGHRLRRHLAETARSDHLGRGCRLQLAFRPQHLAHPHHLAARTCSSIASATRRAPARSRSSSRATSFPIGFEKSIDRKVKEALARHPDREALHEARNPHALLQPDSLRPRHQRRRGGGAAVFQQAREGPDARGSGAHRRHHPVARAPESVRGHGRGNPAAQLRPAADGRRGLHHGGGSRRRRRRRRSC